VRIAHTLHVGFKVCAIAGRVCGAATHVVGREAGYGLLTILNARMRDYFAENDTTENGIRTA